MVVLVQEQDIKNHIVNYNKNIYNFIICTKFWGLGIGDWGLGIGDWGLGPIPNPQYKYYKYKNKIKDNIKIYIIKIYINKLLYIIF